MNWANPIQSLRDHLKVLKWILYLLMAAAIVFDIFIPRHEAHFFGDKIPGFWSVFGIICCILMIRIMKGIAHAWLMKKEEYYG
ncbi:MAG: hypothetical protein HY879_08255 [Deltaproteobacteria bacterium]|jgi:hypothetical protein|nr:hypothetical protein [Deltaproteobacteria bacterium]